MVRTTCSVISVWFVQYILIKPANRNSVKSLLGSLQKDKHGWKMLLLWWTKCLVDPNVPNPGMSEHRYWSVSCPNFFEPKILFPGLIHILRVETSQRFFLFLLLAKCLLEGGSSPPRVVVKKTNRIIQNLLLT